MDSIIPKEFNLPMEHSQSIRENKIFIQDVDEETALKFDYYVSRFKEIDKKLGIKTPINVIINSYGGLLTTTFSIISSIEQLKSEGYIVKSYTRGMAYSAGFFISIVASERYGQQNSKFLFHDGRYFSYGTKTSEDDRRKWEESKESTRLLKSIVSKYTNISEQTMDDYIGRKEDYLFDSNKALELGVIDKIL